MITPRLIGSLTILIFLLIYPFQTTFGQIDNEVPLNPLSPSITTVIYLPTISRTYTLSRPTGQIIIDHTSVESFERIPERYLTAARNLRMLFSDRSVGQNIHEALDCLTATSWGESLASCRRDYYDANWNWKTYMETDLASGFVPDRLLFDPDPLIYNRANWTFEYRTGTWSELTHDFVTSLAPAYINSKEVLSYQFSYLNVGDTSDIATPSTGFFSNNPNLYDVYDLEDFIDQHPGKTFIFWTTSLARGIGNPISTSFNSQMRQYAAANNKILFDVADIESHTHLGVPCFDNRDGVPYCNDTECENHANDGVNYPAICQDYTTEIDGGHLGSVSSGKIRIAKAFWVLMARITGWDGISP